MSAAAAPEPGHEPFRVRFSSAHLGALNRRRRLVLQEDANMPFEAFRLPFDRWLDFRFRHCDNPASQVDGIWWDIGLAEDTYAIYDSALLPRLQLEGFDAWCEQGIDWPGELVRACHERGLEAFWNKRVCPVDFAQPKRIDERLPHDHPSRRNPVKQANPEWVNPCWWPQGLWNLAVPAVHLRKVAILRELLERYPLDGIQLDFARHTPCLPPGREWAMRDHATAFVRQVRRMMLEIENATDHPRLLAVRIGETIEGNHLDGLEVERWIDEDLVDILTLGGRTTTLDVPAFADLVGQGPQKLCASFDGHHTTDGYYFPPEDYLRGVFRNFRQQGIETVSLFNWACAPPDAYDEMGLPHTMKCASHTAMLSRAGSLDTLVGDRLYAVERRGGYPWAGNYLYRNDDRPLPATLPTEPSTRDLPLDIYDDLSADSDIQSMQLAVILRCLGENVLVRTALNGRDLSTHSRDPGWKDSQIYGDGPQPSAGAANFYARVDPDQRLVRIEYNVPKTACRVGSNTVSLTLVQNGGDDKNRAVVEKVELRVSA